MNLFGKFFSKIARMCANAGSTACTWLIIDEPETPASLIEK